MGFPGVGKGVEGFQFKADEIEIFGFSFITTLDDERKGATISPLAGNARRDFDVNVDRNTCCDRLFCPRDSFFYITGTRFEMPMRSNLRRR